MLIRIACELVFVSFVLIISPLPCICDKTYSSRSTIVPRMQTKGSSTMCAVPSRCPHVRVLECIMEGHKFPYHLRYALALTVLPFSSI